MSGSTRIARFMLIQSQELVSKVPESRIFLGNIPIKTVFPAISVTEISSNQRKTVSMSEPDRVTTSRVQITVHAKSYQEQKTLLESIRRAMPMISGMLCGFRVLSVLPDTVGPDLADVELNLFIQSRDYIITYVER